jgi:hypothetical protein
MIGTIRKHSVWLWWVVAVLTIASFIWWGASPGTRYGSGRNGGLGVIYGKPVTPETFSAANREFLIYYWTRSHEFPDKDPNFTRADLERETYVRLLLTAKAKELGIHVGEDAQVAAANDFLGSLGQKGQPVPMSMFVDRVLTPEGLTAADFQRFIVDDLIIQQLIQTLGLPGALIAPQEASQLYDRAHQEISAQAVFFSASNYLAQVTVTPATVGQFYTNFMAHYRLPDRVQINYVEFDLSNFMAAAELKVGKTNIANQAEAEYAQHGLESVPGAKTPEEAKAKLREAILRKNAGLAAIDQARQFVNTLFAMSPVMPENLEALAKKNGLAVHTTAPFSEADGPAEFAASTELIQTAFKLNADSPYSKPLPGSEAVYVIGLAKQLPSAIQPFDEIRDRVTEDFRTYEGTLKARSAGTNFFYGVSVQMATGKSFAQAALAAGQKPVALKPFSLSSQEVPEAEGHAEVGQIKQAAFTTKLGHVSQFEPTADGGFVLFAQSMLPVDEAAKKSDMPQFLSQVRRSRENEAFNLWLQAEASRELRNTPYYDEMMHGKSSSGSR